MMTQLYELKKHLIILLLLLVPLIYSCNAWDKKDRIAIVKRFLEAEERNDSAACRNMVSPEMRVWYEEIKGEGEKWSPTSAWDVWDAFFHSVITYGKFTEDSNSVTVLIQETNDFYKLIDRSTSQVQLIWWVNNDDKIEGHLVKSVRDSSNRGRFKEFIEWAKKNQTEELEYLMRGEKINPEGDRPQRWKKILIEWRTKTGLPVY
jgi:hypothetical protein